MKGKYIKVNLLSCLFNKKSTSILIYQKHLNTRSSLFSKYEILLKIAFTTAFSLSYLLKNALSFSEVVAQRLSFKKGILEFCGEKDHLFL